MGNDFDGPIWRRDVKRAARRTDREEREERPRHLQPPLPSNIAGAEKGPFVADVAAVIERTLEITRKDGRSRDAEGGERVRE